MSANASSVDAFREELLEFIEREGYTLSQIFNADETGLWWKLMPSRTFVRGGETHAKNFKQPKDRVTLMGCANAAGTCKLPLVFIHKYLRPRCFKNMSLNDLPVNYFKPKKNWMGTTIFLKWFHDIFVPKVRKFCMDNDIQYKVLLLLDNAPAHPSSTILQSNDGKVIIKILPPNTTSLIQPMDQGILECMKRRYKKSLLHYIVVQNDCSSKSIPEIVKQLNIKDADFWSTQAWDEVSSETLSRGWNKLLQTSVSSSMASSPSTSEDGTEFVELIGSLGLHEGDDHWQNPEEWLREDSSDPGYQLLEDEEIVASINGTEIEDQDSESDKEVQPQVSHTQAFQAFEVALQWLESQGTTDPAHLQLVKQWRDQAASKRITSLKQTNLTLFLKDKQ